jgi:hypothetical protein
MSKWKRILIPVVTLALLAACGGGGGGGDGGNNADNLGEKSFPAVANSQSFADSAVDEVNGLVEEIFNAELAGDVGNTVPFSIPVVAGPPSAATFTEPVACGEELGGVSGSGTVEVTIVYDEGEDFLSSISANFIDCHIEYEDDTSTTLDGTYSMEYTDYVDEDHYTITYVYDLDYVDEGPGYSDSGTLRSAQVCTQDGDELECQYAIGGGYALGEYDVYAEGDLIIVDYAYIVAANSIIEIDEWEYDTELERATSGDIEITYENGDSIEIFATDDGYEVDITIGMDTYSFDVTFDT